MTAATDPIKHVVILMLENRSFDHMLGCMKSVYPGLTGIDPNNPGHNSDGTFDYKQTAGAAFALPVGVDPSHETRDVLQQIGTKENPCTDFVSNFLYWFHNDTSGAQEVMNYFDRNVEGSTPVLHTLAENFMICDHWYSSVPGPTWANRFFVHSGTSLGRVKMPAASTGIANLHLYNQDTIYDRLNDQRITWRIYHDGFPQSLTLARLALIPTNAAHFHSMGQFFDDAKGAESAFPKYTFIEPAYFGEGQNDQHPPTNVLSGEALIANVYNAIRANDELWNSTLLVLLYDEHGGFYDSEFPPPAPPPDDHNEEYTFDQFGVRVPAILISPWVERGFSDTHFDHTSILRYVSDKWRLGRLTARVDKANSVEGLIKPMASPRIDTPSTIQPPALPVAPSQSGGIFGPLVSVGADRIDLGPEAEEFAVELNAMQPEPKLNELQKSLVAYSDVLEQQITDTAENKLSRQQRLVESANDGVNVAHERLNRFMAQQKAKAAR